MAGRARLTPQLTAARINHLGALISLRHSMCLICYGRAMAYTVDATTPCCYCFYLPAAAAALAEQ